MSLVDLGKRLLESAKRGDTDDVRTLMSNGAPFTTDWLGTSPLHFSAQFGHISTAEVLLRAGISRDARTKVDRTPLHVAAQEGHVEIVNLLLQHAADIDAKDMLKMTPLHWATEKGHLSVVEVLLKAGADVNCENKFDKTPLDIAIINGRPDIVQTIQLAQHTAVGNLQEPTETVTVETSEVGEAAIMEATDHISIEGHTITADTDDSNLLLQNMRQMKTETSDESAEEGNSTSVLATLAALAEATAQNNNTNTNTSEAINWLESQGITMITTSDGNIITSAVESGQTITLTEAGKIALNIIKQQGLTDDEVLNEIEDDKVDDKVITYVTEGTEMPVEESNLQIQSVTTISEPDGTQTVITEADHDDVQEEAEEEEVVDDGEPAMKIARLADEADQEPETIVEETTEIDVDALLQKSNGVPDDGGAGDPGVVVADLVDTGEVEEISDQEKLRRELEEIKRQAEAFKEQLKQKDKDLEEYKKQLGEMSDKGDEPGKS